MKDLWLVKIGKYVHAWRIDPVCVRPRAEKQYLATETRRPHVWAWNYRGQRGASAIHPEREVAEAMARERLWEEWA